MNRFTPLVFFIFSIFQLNAMPLHRAIISSDTNPMYLDFWPLTATAWQEVAGIRPTLALIAPADVEIDETIGDVIRFEPIPGIPTSFQAQVIRLLLPAYFPDEVCITSDIDMFPMQRDYFVDSIRECSEDAFAIYRDEEYKRWNYLQYPICYLAAKGSTFQKLFDLHSIEDIQEKIKEWYALGWGWCTDELVVYKNVQEKLGQMPIEFLGHVVSKRIDRVDWHPRSDLIASRDYIDVHLLRPYEIFQFEIDQILIDLQLGHIRKEPKITLSEQINSWQHRDTDGSVLPWYTKPFLDELKIWDISRWDVLECGSGHSTIWLASHCKSIVCIEDNREWTNAIYGSLLKKGLSEVDIRLRSAVLYQKADGAITCDFVEAIDEDDKMYDCVTIDGASRNLCVEKALKHVKPGGIIIFDNANQTSCEVDASPTLQLLSKYEYHSYLQPGHPDWRTDYWVIDDEAPCKEIYPTQTEKVLYRTIGDSAFGTHMTPLITAIVNTTGPILEMGCGDYSTPLIHAICSKTSRFLLSTETDPDWIGLFLDLERSWHRFQYVPCYAGYDWSGSHLWDHVGKDMPKWGVVFIDHRPAERRVVDIERMRNKADIIVVHDTESPAYGYEPTLSSFKYRYDYVRYATRTTLVSETVDVASLFN